MKRSFTGLLILLICICVYVYLHKRSSSGGSVLPFHAKSGENRVAGSEGHHAVAEPVAASPGDVLESLRPMDCQGKAEDGVKKPPEAGSLTISGQVVSRDGVPVHGAEVAGSVCGGAAEAVVTGVSDADGRFVLSGLAEARYDVAAMGPGGGFGWVGSVAAGSQNVVITLQSTGEISGRVYDERSAEGLPGAKVKAVPLEDMPLRDQALLAQSLQETLSDARGHFSIFVVTPGIYKVAAGSLPGYMNSSTSQQPRIVLREGESRSGVQIGLARAASVSGTVLDPSNQALPYAQVQLLRANFDGGAQTALCGDSGNFIFESVKPGMSFVVRASHPKYAATVSDDFTLDSGEQLAGLRLQLSNGNTVNGQVITSDGQGVGGVEVSLSPGSSRSLASIPYLSATTESGGQFEIANVSAGVYAPLVITHSGPEAHNTIVTGDPFTMPSDQGVSGLVINIGSSQESVHEFRLGEFSQAMV